MLHARTANIRCDRYYSNFLNFGVQLKKASVSVFPFLGAEIELLCSVCLCVNILRKRLDRVAKAILGAYTFSLMVVALVW